MQKTKKRFLSALLACAMLVSLFPFAAFAENGNVAKIGEREYATLQEAINEAASGAEIELIADTTENITVAADDNITLDLNGHKVTNTNTHTISNNGHLVIKDDSSASAATGTVDNITHGKAAIYNDGTLTIQGGMYTRSLETQDWVDDGADNSWYTVVNVGTMTINDGFFTTADGQSENLGNRSSLIRNGDDTSPGNLTISNGKFVSGANVIKNEPGSVIEAITGGTFTMDNSKIAWYGGNCLLQSYGTIKTISGGVFKALGDGLSIDGDTSYYRHGIAVYDDGKIENIGGTATFEMEGSQNRLIRCDDNGSIQISGGNYALSEPEADNNVFCYKPDETATISITGGTFSGNVKDYVLTGYKCVSQDGKYVVQESSTEMGANTSTSGSTANTVVGGNLGNNQSSGGVVANSGTVSITATTGSEGAQNDSVTNSNVTIAKAALTSLNNTDKNVEIKTDVATVTMDSDALNAMTTNAAGDGVVLSVEKTAAEADNNSPLTYSITAVTSTDNKEVYDSNSAAGSVTIRVPYNAGDEPQVYYVGANGLEKMEAELTGTTLSWTTSHFSDYVVLSDSTVATVTDNGTVKEYASLEDAITAANGKVTNPVVDIVKNATIRTSTVQSNDGIVPITKTMTINGHGNTISYTGEKDGSNPQKGGLFAISADNVVLKDVTIDVKQIKHAVQFYKTTGGELNNVTINGADWTAVQVNGAQKVALNNCVLNPNAGAYANIEYALGQGVTTIPSMTIKNVSTSDVCPAVWVDDTTVAAMKAAMGAGTSDEQVQKELLKQVTYTSNNGGSLKLSVEFVADQPATPVYVESTYQPPYTGKYSYAINVADMDNGSVSVDKYATEGEKVTLTVSPDKAYKLDELTVTAGGKDVELTDNGNGTYTFTMPSSKVQISAAFVEDKDYVEPDTSITISMSIGSNDFVINNNIVTVPDAAPYIANSRTYVPFRALGEALGATVEWDNDARTVTYTLGDIEIVMTIGDTTYTINGVEQSMDVAPEITGDRTYVPVRFVAEGLGFKVTPLYAADGTTASVVFEK